MSKRRTLISKGPECDIHRLPCDVHEVYHQYGLWISHFKAGIAEAAGKYFNKAPRYFEFYSISHFYKGSGRLWLPPNHEQELEPGQCIIMFPNMINKYGGIEEDFCEDFINFAGPIADKLAACGIIKAGVFPFGNTRRLLPIMDIASEPSLDAQIEASLMLQRLLLELYRENRGQEDKSDVRIKHLLKAIKQNIRHWWTVSEMAEFCQYSADQLRRIFIREVGMHPKHYIDRVKMQAASSMLTNSSRTVREIAQELGYRDQFHFSRRFKAIVGFSPQAYRDRFGRTEEL